MLWRPVSTLRTRPAASCRPGKVLALREPTLPHVRVDSGLAEGMVVSSAYDPVMAQGIAGRHHQHRIRCREDGTAVRGSFREDGRRVGSGRCVCHSAGADGEAGPFGRWARREGAARAWRSWRLRCAPAEPAAVAVGGRGGGRRARVQPPSSRVICAIAVAGGGPSRSVAAFCSAWAAVWILGIGTVRGLRASSQRGTWSRSGHGRGSLSVAHHRKPSVSAGQRLQSITHHACWIR